MIRRRSTLPAIFAVTAALGLAACGDDASTPAAATASTPAPAAAGQIVKVAAEAGNKLRFTKSTYRAKAGKVTLQFTNPASAAMPHAVAIEGQGLDDASAVVNPGKGSSVTVSVKSGSYVLYCPVPGHRQAGMVAKLTVG